LNAYTLNLFEADARWRYAVCAVMRRILAVVAMLTFSLAYLSAEAVGLAAATPECCSAGMCPMHRMNSHAPNCDTDMSHPGSQLQSCPSHSVRYAGLPDFIRVAPPALTTAEQPVERAPLFASPVAMEIAFDVAAPPPRNILI
jgi:hypothetical protein